LAEESGENDMKNVFVVAGSFDEFRTYVKYQTALTKKKIKYSFVKDICNLYDNKNKDIRYIGSYMNRMDINK
jgi:hypothetical protein